MEFRSQLDFSLRKEEERGGGNPMRNDEHTHSDLRRDESPRLGRGGVLTFRDLSPEENWIYPSLQESQGPLCTRGDGECSKTWACLCKPRKTKENGKFMRNKSFWPGTVSRVSKFRKVLLCWPLCLCGHNHPTQYKFEIFTGEHLQHYHDQLP